MFVHRWAERRGASTNKHKRHPSMTRPSKSWPSTVSRALLRHCPNPTASPCVFLKPVVIVRAKSSSVSLCQHV